MSDFYNRLAPFYHLIYPDWYASIDRQASTLDAIIRERLPHPITILDIACGIGTQALGLAALGYDVTASDLSSASVDNTFYFVEDGGTASTTHVMRSKFHAVNLDRLAELMTEAGFVDVERVDGRFFQPLLIGRR